MLFGTAAFDPLLAPFLSAGDIHHGVAMNVAYLALTDHELSGTKAARLGGYVWPRGDLRDDGFGCAAHIFQANETRLSFYPPSIQTEE